MGKLVGKGRFARKKKPSIKVDGTPGKHSVPKKGLPTNDEIAVALKKYHGIIGRAAYELGMERATVSLRISHSEMLQEVMKACREDIADMAESGLVGNLKRGDMSAVKYVLTTLGKARGYTERIEQATQMANIPNLSSLSIEQLQMVVNIKLPEKSNGNGNGKLIGHDLGEQEANIETVQ